jgi:hypothetical protein
VRSLLKARTLASTNRSPTGVPGITNSASALPSAPVIPDRGKLTTPLRAVLAFACGFVVCQPIMYWLIHLLPPRPRAIVTLHEWIVFELEVAFLGAIAGVWWYYSRRPTPRTRVQYWADPGLSVLAIGALMNADQSVKMPWFLWIPLPVVVAPILGFAFGSIALFVANSINASRTG